MLSPWTATPFPRLAEGCFGVVTQLNLPALSGFAT
jgi:hypothetical protein